MIHPPRTQRHSPLLSHPLYGIATGKDDPDYSLVPKLDAICSFHFCCFRNLITMDQESAPHVTAPIETRILDGVQKEPFPSSLRRKWRFSLSNEDAKDVLLDARVEPSKARNP